MRIVGRLKVNDTTVWRSPEALVAIGFQRSSVVMMNEVHSGLQRCIRTREIGRCILSAAHQAGARHLAMEVLWPYSFAAEANRTRQVPVVPEEGYLAQPEMRLFIQAALDLGWTLVPYEADYEAHPAELEKWESINLNQEQQAHSRSKALMESQNWREDQQARAIANTLDELPPGTRLLVWCGWGHHAKTAFWGHLPMGYRFRELSGIDHFALDQAVTVDGDAEDSQEESYLAEQYASELAAYGGTAGFLTEDSPVSFLRDREDYDAFILSTQNEMA